MLHLDKPKRLMICKTKYAFGLSNPLRYMVQDPHRYTLCLPFFCFHFHEKLNMCMIYKITPYFMRWCNISLSYKFWRNQVRQQRENLPMA